MKREIDAVLFDLDDTLHDDTFAFMSAAQEVADEVALEHGIDALALKDAYVAQANGFWKKLSAEALDVRLAGVRAKLWQAALDRVGIGSAELAERSARHYHAYRKKYFRVFPGARELLADLRTKGKRLGLLTNGFAETHREKIELLQLTAAFDAIFIADEVGMLKPDPLLFAHACERLGAPPSRTAMVGDRYERDIHGALIAGLYTVWFNLRDEPLPAGAKPPHATAATIAGVAEVLAAS